jgi:hypothetical protein
MIVDLHVCHRTRSLFSCNLDLGDLPLPPLNSDLDFDTRRLTVRDIVYFFYMEQTPEGDAAPGITLVVEYLGHSEEGPSPEQATELKELLRAFPCISKIA